MEIKKEVWVDVYNYEDYYKVSSYGRFIDKRTNKFKRPNIKNLTICLTREKGDSRKLSARRLIYKSFNPDSKNEWVIYTKYKQLNPLDIDNIGIKADNYYINKKAIKR